MSDFFNRSGSPINFLIVQCTQIKILIQYQDKENEEHAFILD